MTTNTRRGAGLTFLIGLFLLIEGIWGCFSPIVFGGLSLNHTQAVLHLALGVGAVIASGIRPATYLAFVGLALLFIGVLWALPDSRDSIEHALAVNRPGAILDVTLGVLCLLTSQVARSRLPFDDDGADSRHRTVL